MSLSAAEGLIEWTLEGDISSWQSGDDLDIYNGWDSVQGPCDQLNTDQGTATFTAEQEVRCYAGTYTENVTIPNTLDTTNAFKLVLAANSGDSVTITQIGISHTLHLGPWTADVLVRGMI
ncbi:MAG: hypothetical protein GWN58_44590, partial [Anaerolineae bacterium]|nr:hypothetical protein [Anaerolineae bacterium]